VKSVLKLIVFIGMITPLTLPAAELLSTECPNLFSDLHRPLSRPEFEQTLQAEWESFLRQEGKGLTHQPVSNLFKIAPKYIRNDKKSRLGLNRYSNERGYQNGIYDAWTAMTEPQVVGAQFTQMHTKLFSKIDGKNMRRIGETAKKVGIEIQIDISSTDAKAFDEVFRIADVIGDVRVIRTYIREPGMVKDMIEKAVSDLRAASEIAAKRGMIILLEQHEVTIAKEIRAILERVNEGKEKPNVFALFDFANSITAGEHPENSLATLQGKIRNAHVKDAIDANGNQLGVKLQEGDLNPRRMIFDLVLDGVDVSIQTVVGYHAEKADRSKYFNMRLPSWTYIPEKVVKDQFEKEKLLQTEADDAREQFEHLQWIRAKLLDFAKRAQSEDWQNDSGSKIPEFYWVQSRESLLVNEIESIGRELFPKHPKIIWAVSPEMSVSEWIGLSHRGGSKRSLQGAMALIRKAQQLKEVLSPPLYSPTFSETK